MHLNVLHELKKLNAKREMDLKKIVPEQDVLLFSPSKNSLKKGRFDFLVETSKGKIIGIEVLCRPTQGKMKEKLLYAKEVDEFIFVLPNNSLEFYRKPKNKAFHSMARPNYFDADFSIPNLSVWLFDLRQGIFSEKGRFNKIFNVKNSN